jgi:hypothetical protein
MIHLFVVAEKDFLKYLTLIVKVILDFIALLKIECFLIFTLFLLLLLTNIQYIN